MFYTCIKGGLGNQMFQYAYGYAAAKKAGLELSLDISAYDRQFAKDTPRNFTLQNYNIAARIAPKNETAHFHTGSMTLLRRIRNKLFPFNHLVFDPRQSDIRDGQLKEGFWQSEKYFEDSADDIRRQFTLKNPFGPEAVMAIGEIASCKEKGITTLLVHVRRGDFVTNAHAIAHHGVLEPEYFINGIKLIRERLSLAAQHHENRAIHIFFASEDRAWVAEHVKTDMPSTFITRPGIKDYEELLIMSMCDHFVISNSSFSWWAAWLSKNAQKIVIAPKKWVANPTIRTDDAVPPNWLRI